MTGLSRTVRRQRKAKREGLCHQLCGRPRVDGQSLCEECRAKNRARSRAAWERRAERDAHPCGRCGATIVKGQLCTTCSRTVRAAMLWGDEDGMTRPALGVLPSEVSG